MQLEIAIESYVPFSVFLSRHAPHADDDDSCSINSDPEAKVCKKCAFSDQVIVLHQNNDFG